MEGLFFNSKLSNTTAFDAACIPMCGEMGCDSCTVYMTPDVIEEE